MKRMTPVLFLMMLFGLPLAGVWVAGDEVFSYLEFPPRTQSIEHAPFSWPVFIGLGLLILVVVLPFLFQIARARSSRAPRPAVRSFPWWGWLALALGGCFWTIAWTRQAWFAPFQLYTFTPQWLCYIVVINALTWRKTGRCLLTHETKVFAGLFPISAVFWWGFEYLNRFVQNWWYTCGAEFSPMQYFFAATLPFATVLPAVLSTEEWLASGSLKTTGLAAFIPIRFGRPRVVAWVTLGVAAGGLFFIGWFPNLLFPLLWVAPLLLLMAFQCLENRSAFFPELGAGDWRRVFRFALAALICGAFWEMWNWNSLAKWIYDIPYVGRFRVFEMPILGYSGYLPFGLECAAIAQLITRRVSWINVS